MCQTNNKNMTLTVGHPISSALICTTETPKTGGHPHRPSTPASQLAHPYLHHHTQADTTRAQRTHHHTRCIRHTRKK